MTHAPKLSKRESTVMLGDLLSQMQVKDAKGEMIDFVYKSSHVFSERHPERAAECWDENLVTHILEAGFDVKGNEHFKKLSHDIHDTLEGKDFLYGWSSFPKDLHYTIEDIVTEGTLKDGKVTVRATISGKWVKPVGDTPAPNTLIRIVNMGIWRIKDGKMVECWSIGTSPDDWKMAWGKLYAKQ